MDATTLKSIQSPLKAKYQSDPSAAMITLRATGKVGEGISCNVETGRAIVAAGLHPATGGTGLELCSGDMLLQALVACAGVTLRTVATAIGVDQIDGEITAQGDLDFRGTLGVSKDVAVGFTSIRLLFNIVSGATVEQVESIKKLTERYCVVYQTLVNGVRVDTSYSRAI